MPEQAPQTPAPRPPVVTQGVSALLEGQAEALIPEGNPRMARRRIAGEAKPTTNGNGKSNGNAQASGDGPGNGVVKTNGNGVARANGAGNGSSSR